MSLTDAPDQVHRLRAVAHPLRLEMLSLLTGTQLSAAEVARELGTTQANASYHLRLLLSAGLIVVAGEEKVNGGVARRYRALWDHQQPRDPDAPPGRADAESDAEIRAMVDALSTRVAQRRRGLPGHYTDAALWVEPEVWNRVTALLHEASFLLHESARPPRTAGTERVNLSVLAFRLDDGDGERDRDPEAGR